MSSEERKLFFRNYKPRDPDLQELMLPKPTIPKIQIDIDTNIISETNGQIDLRTIAPDRDTLDLKRDVHEKMEVLQRRTERAIARLTLNTNKKQPPS